MTLTRSYKTAPCALLVVFLAVAVGGCSAGSRTTPPQTSAAAASDWGTDWTGLLQPAGGNGSAAGSRTSTWSIVLVTFSSPGHGEAATRTVRQLRAVDPRLAAARVHNTGKGSLVVYGAYQSVDSPDAQRDLAWVKQLTINERPAFPRAMLGRIRRTGRVGVHPHDLMSARLRHPTVDPLYALEVAMWSDFESGQLTLQEIHRSAEAYVNELRGQGLEAYFYHDDDKRVSSVTVGLFDRTAIDTRTMIYSPALMELMKRFPARMVNGEILREPIDARRPSRGTRIQAPSLVLVPKL